MKDEKLGRKTSPGFADPNAPVRLDRAAAVVGMPVASPAQTPVAMPALRNEAAPAAAAPIPSAKPSVPPGAHRIRGKSKPLIEVEVVRERSRAPRPEPLIGCYEIWTQNNVYAVDSRMRCIAVREVGTGEAKTDHPFVGARLVGGQAQEAAMEMSHPLPRIGAHAVFEMRRGSRRQFTRTSPVERVVLRLRIVTIADGADVPSWEDLIEEDE